MQPFFILMIHFIANFTGGRGKAERNWNRIERYLKESGIPYLLQKTSYKGHASNISRELSQLDEKQVNIVVIGGDGTINEAVNGITDFSKVTFSAIPSGSGNDFARGVKLSKHFPLKNLKHIIKKIESNSAKKLDVGKLSFIHDGKQIEKRFLISSGFGMDALVCVNVDKSKLKTVMNRLHLGKLTYLFQTLVSLFYLTKLNLKVIFDETEERTFTRTAFFTSMNMKKQGGGIRFAPDALYDDGKISVCVAHSLSKLQCFFVLPFIVFGLHKFLKKFYFRNFHTAKVISDTPYILHTDGEVFMNVKEFTVSVIDEKLNAFI